MYEPEGSRKPQGNPQIQLIWGHRGSQKMNQVLLFQKEFVHFGECHNKGLELAKEAVLAKL